MFNKILISIIIKIIEEVILKNKNCTEISKYLKEYYNLNTINQTIIYRVVLLIRKSISHFLKDLL